VSHDFVPKKAYYEMAQANQPVVPLPQLRNRGTAMDVYVANDLPDDLHGCTVCWTVRQGEQTLVEGSCHGNAAALDATRLATVDLSGIGGDVAVVSVALSVDDSTGKRISGYHRELFLRAWRLENAILPAKPKSPAHE
jgi:hypothetical protein